MSIPSLSTSKKYLSMLNGYAKKLKMSSHVPSVFQMIDEHNKGILTSLEYIFIVMMSDSRSFARLMSTGDGAATGSAC